MSVRAWKTSLAVGVLVIGIAVALGLTLHGRSSAGAPAKGRSGLAKSKHVVLFGISDPALISQPPARQAKQLAMMKAIGINSLRLDANWNWVEHLRPTERHWGQIDREIRAAKRVGISVDLIIDGCPPWAALPGTAYDPIPQPANPSQYARWARDVAQRYAPLGVHIYEIWNEPNDSKYWQPRANPAFYAKMLTLAYRAIKHVDPKATVLVGGLAPGVTANGNYSAMDFLRVIYAHGAGGYFDALAVHPYTFPLLPGTYEPWSAWSLMGQTGPSLRTILSAHGQGNLPIWVTEFGAPSQGPRGIGSRGQAVSLKQAIEIAKQTRWISAIYIYSWQDIGNNPTRNADWYGLLTSHGKPKPALMAVAAAIR